MLKRDVRKAKKQKKYIENRVVKLTTSGSFSDCAWIFLKDSSLSEQDINNACFVCKKWLNIIQQLYSRIKLVEIAFCTAKRYSHGFIDQIQYVLISENTNINELLASRPIDSIYKLRKSHWSKRLYSSLIIENDTLYNRCDCRPAKKSCFPSAHTCIRCCKRVVFNREDVKNLAITQWALSNALYLK